MHRPETAPCATIRPLLAALALLLPLALPACDVGAEGLDQAAVDRCARRAAAALAEHADLELPVLPPVLLLSTEEARARREAYVEGLGEDDSGFTKAVDVMADQLLGDAMLGRYLPDEQVVYILGDVLVAQAGDDLARAESMLFGLLAHELVHAYDDQVYGVMPSPDDLLAFLEQPTGVIDIQTRMSLLEGRAAYASELACRGVGEEPLDVPSEDDVRRARVLDGGDSVPGEVLADVGNALARMKLMQYVQGYAFSRDAWAYGGERFFGHVFGSLPLSMDELEDFDAFRLRWAEELEERLLAEEDAALAEEAGSGDPEPGSGP